MMEVTVYNTGGEKVDTIQIDESVFGSDVNVSLVKQAVVAYNANCRQGTVATRTVFWASRPGRLGGGDLGDESVTGPGGRLCAVQG